MSAMSLTELIPVLQVAIGPVILISGVGLLLLTMTNRLGRTIDRARQLAKEVDSPDADRTHIAEQVVTIYRRARVLRLTITLAGMSVLLAAVLIIALFLAALLKKDSGLMITVIFIACLGSLIGSLIGFIYDIHLSLAALRLELSQVNADVK
ncbi:MAG: DUF2721 domain-containing protein [Verrucomicrobia bacterium]|jgi:hypothetical protein|nr:MAG: DUF2721 domain-containing protein [Verrucomicrobiota bacterium]